VFINKYSYILSLENLQGDSEPRFDPLSDLIEQIDNNNFEINILNKFSGIEKDVVSLIFEGYNLHQISQFLGLTVNQIYKIRKKILKTVSFDIKRDPKVPKKKIFFYENLIMLYHLRFPEKNEEEIYKNWENDPILKEYKKPKYNIFCEKKKKIKIDK
jgi:hypothetical protein